MASRFVGIFYFFFKKFGACCGPVVLPSSLWRKEIFFFFIYLKHITSAMNDDAATNLFSKRNYKQKITVIAI